MASFGSNKRLKSDGGAPISASRTNASSALSGAANLPAYQPPPQIGARGMSGRPITADPPEAFLPSGLQPSTSDSARATVSGDVPEPHCILRASSFVPSHAENVTSASLTTTTTMPSARRSARTVSSTAARESAQPYTRANFPTSPDAARPSASVARQPSGKAALRITVKAPPSKLRQATSGSQVSYAQDPSESDTTPAPRPARATRNPRVVLEPDSDDDVDDDEDEVEDDGEELDASGDEDMDGDPEDDLDDDEEADGEEDAAAEDEEMEDDHPPPPRIKQERAGGKGKPSVTVIAPPEGPLKSVEDKEMEDEEDGDDLSELESEEGENEEGDGEEVDSDEDERGSRSATPDLTKLTKRQRGAFEEEAGLLALSNEAQKKKQLTAEEHAMRRAEMARRRKNLSEKRNEEEKMDTINKLLKKPAPKRRTRAEIEAAKTSEMTPGDEDGEEERADPLYMRWVNRREGSYIGVPREWLEAPVGEALQRGRHGVRIQDVA